MLGGGGGRGLPNGAWPAFLGSVLLFGVLVALLVWNSTDSLTATTPEPLIVYCAVSLKPPVEAAAREYERTFGVPVQLTYGGSQTLIASAELSHRGDLYIPADDDYLRIARAKGLLGESFPLARMVPVLAVHKDNPKHIQSLNDLFRSGSDVKLCQANPDAAAIGRLTREVFQKTGDWDRLKARTVVFKPTVNDVANDLQLRTVDAGFVWDATVRQFPDLLRIDVDELKQKSALVPVCVLRTSTRPAAALRFARYLAAPDKGLRYFEQNGYTVVISESPLPVHPRDEARAASPPP